MNEIVGIMQLESIASGAPSGIAVYSWFKNGTDGEVTCRFVDTETNTWCSEAMSPREAVRSMLADGRTITPGMARNLTLDDLEAEEDDPHSLDVLYEIVRFHATRCTCEPCEMWDIRQTEA